MTVAQDTEITLGTGKMLILFFGLVVLCAVFFGMGYNLGRNSTTPPLAAGVPSSPGSASTGAHPAPTRGSASGDANKPDLTFYKAVEQKNADPQLTPAESASAVPAASTQAANPEQNKPPTPPDPTIIGNTPYSVQVAAVSKQEDAEALVDALKKKQYPAFTSNSTADKLYHVQVGPYGDIKDAEAMRAKLISDGYNPILKK